MRFERQEGPFCRDCGIGTVRRMAASTLAEGWWGPFSFFVAQLVLVTCLVQRVFFGRLPAPTRPDPDARPVPMGKPLHRRFAIVGLILPVAVVGLYLWSKHGR
jgi:hypothetical protein